MATYALTKNGAARTLQPGFVITESANGRNRMDFSVLSLDGSERWALDDEVVLTEDGTRIFGGLIDNPVESGFGGTGAAAAIAQRLSAVDFNVYPSRLTVGSDVSRASESLLARLTWIAGLMSAQGVTLDAGQATGPTLIAAEYTSDRYLVDVLNETMALANGTGATSWVWNIDYSKVLSAIEAGSEAAPFSITDGDGNVLGDITVEQPRQSDYANYVIVFGGTGQKDKADSLGTGDGVEDTFTLHYTPVSFYLINVGGSLVDGWPSGGVNETIGDAPAIWGYDSATGTITRRDGPVANGSAVIATMIAQLPVRVYADSGGAAASRVQKTYTLPDVDDVTVLQALANSYLSRDSASPKTVRYAAAYDKTGLHPGQTQTITSTKRNLSGSHLFTDVRIVNVAGNLVQRQVTAVTTTRLPISLREKFQQAFTGSGGSGGGGSVTVVTGGTVLASPVDLGGTDLAALPATALADYAVVYNRRSFHAQGDFTGRVRCELWARDAGVGLTARLYDVTAAASVGGSSEVTSQSRTPQSFIVAITSGHEYRLEVKATTGSGAGYCNAGQLEAV